MKTIKVLGQRNDALKAVDFGDSLENFSVSDAVMFASDRAAADVQMIKDLKEDDVVELIFEDDIHRWVTVAELEKEFKYHISRGEEAGVLEIPGRLPAEGTSRGAVSWVLTGLRVLKYDPVEKTVKEIAEKWDKKNMPEPGLFRYNEGLTTRGEALDNPKITAGDPILLFIHGTFSSTSNGFSSLDPGTWAKLKDKYKERIFGFDHKTLSQSPIQNTLELVQKLPEKAKLHLITHSRGGLIGELLSRSARIDDKQPFDNNDKRLSAEDEEALAQLSDLLVSKKIKVERFVRVACPARGTMLASDRVDRWLELIVNVIGKVIPPGANNIFSALADLLLEIKKQSANPAAMPGLAAMNPASNFIKMINRSDVQVDAGLTVIAGDVEKNNLLGRLATFFTDLFYSREHDLVVQTPAMYGGPTRQASLFFFDQGSDVNHFNYFSNKKTAEKIEEALLGETEELSTLGFKPIQEAFAKPAGEIELRAGSFQKRSSIPQPVVYVLPGIMGTHLSEGENRIWLSLLDLALGKMANLQITNKKVHPDALISMYYGNLVEYLSATHEVISFPYDWRLSILDEAERFADELEAKLKATDQPIRIIGHSMGGLVTHTMIARRPEVWDQIRAREGARFIMLGTPNKGSFKIPRLILGQEKTLRMLALLDIHNSPTQLMEVISRFPGVLQLLPMEDLVWDFTILKTWETFPNSGKEHWVKPLERDLGLASEFQSLFKAQKGKFTADDPVLYVAGHATGAPVGVEISDQGEIVFRGTDQGDGTVPWESGIPPELKDGRTYYMEAGHGDLANHKDSFAAIYDLLTEGKTIRLSKVPPSLGRGEEERYILRDEGVEIYPNQVDLERTILDSTPVPLEVPAAKPVKVSVAHGNLSFCSNPVAVGHYEGDSLYSAEKALDHHLNGRLSARHTLGLYPGTEGTVEVVLNNAGEKPGGAIVVGLGKAGELSPHKLTHSIAMALREYAVKALENDRVSDEGEITISSLLIGTGSMGLSVTNSVDAILNGVLQANKSFAQMVNTRRVGPYRNFNIRVAEVQFIELFKDQAILAARAVNTYRKNPQFAVEPFLQTLRGGWKRIAYDEPPGWWNRIYIRADQDTDGALIFSVPTDRARSEESRLGVQRRNIDRMIAQAVRDPNWDQKLATSMFELLIPNRLKGSFKDMNNIIFVVDEEAASYPWELLYDRRTGEEEPLVIQNGMVRQFTTASFRETVVDIKNKNILVVGNPTNLPPNFANLPGAEQEANLVAVKFEEKDYQVRRAIHTDSTVIMNELFSTDYRVLHLAGHGVYHYEYKHSDLDRPEVVTGMVLGNGVFLTANEIKNKMYIPELVFINCCHLGKLGKENDETDRARTFAFNEFAASLSRELIEMGVKAVVAAGWAVDDAAAMNFAEAFYDRLLRGFTFGQAIKEARFETYRLHKDRTNTWAAYQCYGDPAYRLVTEAQGTSAGQEPFVDVAEAVVKVQQLYEKARTASTLGTKQFKDELQDLHKHINQDNKRWLEDPILLETLGQAFAEVFMFKEAVTFYDEAVKHGKSAASIKAIEQSANCHVRLAVQEFDRDPSSYTNSKANIEKQIAKLSGLMETIGETPERLSMIGSGYKRLAQIASSKPSRVCNAALKHMEKYYHQAWDRMPDQVAKDPYPLVNALVARIALLLRSNDEEKAKKEFPELTKQLEEAKQFADEVKEMEPEDFWAAIGQADLKLLGNLVDYLSPKKTGLSDKVYDELVRDYRIAWKQYGSQRELNSVIEHYAFLVAVLKAFDPDDNLCGVLENIFSTLRSMSEEAD